MQSTHPEAKKENLTGSYLHPRLKVMEAECGEGKSFQGLIGRNKKDYNHPFIEKRRQLILDEKSDKEINETGIQIQGFRINGEALMKMLTCHVDKHHSEDSD